MASWSKCTLYGPGFGDAKKHDAALLICGVNVGNPGQQEPYPTRSDIAHCPGVQLAIEFMIYIQSIYRSPIIMETRHLYAHPAAD